MLSGFIYVTNRAQKLVRGLGLTNNFLQRGKNFIGGGLILRKLEIILRGYVWYEQDSKTASWVRTHK
jgi:hypothetical protein